MMSFKKITALALALIMMLYAIALASCTDDVTDTPDSTDSSESVTEKKMTPDPSFENDNVGEYKSNWG